MLLVYPTSASAILFTISDSRSPFTSMTQYSQHRLLTLPFTPGLYRPWWSARAFPLAEYERAETVREAQNYGGFKRTHTFLSLFFQCDLAATFLLLSCDLAATFLLLSCDLAATFLLLSFDLLLSCDLVRKRVAAKSQESSKSQLSRRKVAAKSQESSS